jgi:osmotically-inducible protein OsmY
MNHDKVIFEKISKMIRRNRAIDTSKLKLTVLSGNAILEGSVPEWSMKCMLEDIVANHPAVRIIRNLLTIQ